TANRAVAPTEVVARYAPGTLLQAGPGIPAWNYGAHPFGWSGPVESDQTVRFVVLGPVAVAVWRIAGVALLALLFIALARASFGPRPALGQFLARGSAAAALLLSCVLAAAPGAARAQSTPDAALLNELRERLTEAPPCAPTCAEIMRAQVHLAGDAAGWDTSGVTAGRLVSGALNLSRQPHAGSAAAGPSWAGSADFPAFVRVMRDVRFDLDWSVTTTVERVAPQSAAFTVAVPLMPGESVLSEGLEVRGEGVALVGLAAGQRQREWISSLAHRDALSLRFDAAPARAEIWRFTVNPQWRVAFSGLPAVLPEDLGSVSWVFEYRPRVGERLDLSVSRPPAVPGRTLAIDAVRQGVTIGRRTSEH